MCDFDVPGAFLNIPLDKSNCPRPIVIKLQSDLPHPLAGQWVLLLKGVYGLKQSNSMFEKDLRKRFTAAGFHADETEPCVYVKRHPTIARKKCIVSMHVDDGHVVHNCPELYQDLVRELESAYGPLTHNDPSTSYLGQSIKTDSTGRVTYSMEGYISRLCTQHGISVSSKTPSDLDLFQPSKDMTPANPAHYQAIIGSLIYCLKCRHDIRKEVVHLSTKSHCPTMSDLRKAHTVLRYLYGTKDWGPSFHTSEGAILYGHVDASFGVHDDGTSHSGYYLSIGRHSAPTVCSSSAQRSCVSLSSMEAEYVALSSCGRRVAHFRHLLEFIGFPQAAPTVIFEDNKSAIKLSVAPHVPRKSRHINVRHHYIRRLIHDGIAILTFVATSAMTADLLTKPLSPALLLPHARRLLNLPAAYGAFFCPGACGV